MFNASTTESLLTYTCRTANELGMCVEIEAAGTMLRSAEYYNRYMDYLRICTEQGAGVIALIVVVFRSQQVGGLAEGLRSIVAETKALELDAQAHIGLWATVLMTSFGTWGLPQMVHKYYGIKDKAEVKRGIVISTLFALIIAAALIQGAKLLQQDDGRGG